MNNIDCKAQLITEDFTGPNSKEACDKIIKALAANFELKDLLESMEEATDLLEVYEAVQVYVVDVKQKIDDETIICESVMKRINEDRELEQFRSEVE